MNLSDNLKKIRKDNNLSQEQLAEKLGVSRQSVSKWESGLAYPEMDKVLQICQMFNLNVDELLNQNIKEVKESKESKASVNKFIDDFLNYITKTIDMLSSMKFREKIKCLFEQIIVLSLLTLVFVIIGALGLFLYDSIFSFLPTGIYYNLSGILGTLYIVFSVIAGVGIFLHIFKVRYLDYYVIVKGDNDKVDLSQKYDENSKDEIKQENKDDKIYIEKKQEKIIIRDPNHSQYRFIKGILKFVILLIRAFAIFVALGFSLLLVFLVMCTVLSFVIIKSGVLFLGSFITIIACIVLNLVLLYILYNFIFGKKIKTDKIALIFIISIILTGTGIGFATIGIKDLYYIDDINSKYYSNQEITIEMKDDLVIKNDYYDRDVEYIESDNSDLKIVCRHSKYYICDFDNYTYNYQNGVNIHVYEESSSFMDHLRDSLNDLNNKNIVDYSKSKIYIYTTKENIEKLKLNLEKYIADEEIRRRNEYEERISELLNENYQNKDEIYNLKQELIEKDNKINELQEIINNYENNTEIE